MNDAVSSSSALLAPLTFNGALQVLDGVWLYRRWRGILLRLRARLGSDGASHTATPALQRGFQ